jgi:hypothetical protein
LDEKCFADAVLKGIELQEIEFWFFTILQTKTKLDS